MPRGTAHCRCRKCGTAFERELSEYGKGASKRLQEKIAWAEQTFDLCTDCWKQQKRAEEQAEGLTCAIRLGPATEKASKIYAVFGGDAYTHKEEIKALGARFTEDYPSGKALDDVLGDLMLTRPRPAWVLVGDDLDALTEKVESIGAKVQLPTPDELDVWAALHNEALKYHAQREAEKAAEAAEKAARIAAELEALGPIPRWPESVNNKWPSGAKWNGKVYGRPGNRAIYLSGDKIPLTDDEAARMEQTYEARKQWRARKEEIEARKENRK